MNEWLYDEMWRFLVYRNLSRNHITGLVPADFGNLRSIMEM